MNIERKHRNRAAGAVVLFLLLFRFSLGFAVEHVSVGTPDTWSVQALVPYVGDTVEFDAPIVLCSNYGKTVVAPWRMYEPLSAGARGSAGYATAVRINNACSFTLTGVPEYHRCGEKIYHLKAVVNASSNLTYVGGEWRGNTREELEQGLPDLGDYRLLVCGFNLENYFMTLGSMGAETEAQRQLQRVKISKALAKINADIYGLVELEHGDAAIQEIVNDLRANLPSRDYRFFHDETSGGGQKSDYVYDANVVECIGKPTVINTEVSNRKRLVCFREIETGEKFIYSINHFKSMSGGTAATDARRVNEAKMVVNFYNSYRRNSGIREDDLLVMGDLNCYAFSDPVKVFLDNGLIDLHRSFHADSSYSYIYGGLTSYIDHALCNRTLHKQVTGMAAYHINSDESDYYTYDKSSDSSMFRCSDHDPVLVGLALDSTLSGDPYLSNDFAQDSLSIFYTYAQGEENTAPLMYFDIYTISGFRICAPTRVDFHGVLPEIHKKYYTFTDTNPYLPDEIKNLLPLPSGVYIIRFYYDGEIQSHKFIVR